MINNTLPQGLYRKLAAYSVAIAFSFGIILSLYQIYNDYKQQESRLESELNRRVAEVKPSAEKAIYEFDEKLGKLIIDNLFLEPTILEVAIIDDYGDTFQQQTSRTAITRPNWLPQWLIIQTKELQFSLDIPSDANTNSAYLKLVIDPYLAIDDFVQRSWLIIITGIVRNTLLAFALLLLCYHQVTKPVNLLVHRLNNIDPFADNDNQLTVSKRHKNDELGSLAKMINQLLERIQTGLINIKNLNSELNSEVSERMQIEEAINYAEQHTAGITGVDYINKMARFLNKTLQLNGVSVTQYQSKNNSKSFKHLANYDVKLASTNKYIAYNALSFDPTNELEDFFIVSTFDDSKLIAIYQSNLLIIPLKKRPDNLVGLLILISQEPFTKSFYNQHKSLLQIFSSRLTTEIERTTQERTIRRLAHTDTLTKLSNRYYFNNHLKAMLVDVKNNQQRLALILLDLDRFKWVNDSFGHLVGDKLLVQVSERIKKQLPNENLLARIGGDEFTTVVKIANHGEEQIITAKILKAFEEPFLIDNHVIATQTSIGISIYPDSADNQQDLLKNADMAIYMAKHNSESNVQYYSETISKQVQRKLIIENALSQALKSNSLTLAYQAKFSLQSGLIVGCEALVRWHHPELGNISPSEFIPIAEETGLIHDLGKWVLSQASQQAIQWNQNRDEILRIAINFSAYQLQSPLLITNFLTEIKKHKLKPHLVELEITETALIKEPEVTATRLQKLSEIGVHISIDDFGTGYSSLKLLKLLPINTLKIDASFVAGIPNNPSDINIVKATVALAKAMNMQLVAEGVETSEQSEFLLNLGCDIGQGYYYSRPMPAKEFSQLLDNQGKDSISIKQIQEQS